MADPMLLQKQLKDNSEDLHNFVRDLKLWEEEMKRKDRQLSNDQTEELLPPVRRAKLSSNKVNCKKEGEEEDKKNKKIASYDYNKWDKFDVEKACEEVDNEDNKNYELEEDSNLEDEKYLREKALYEKELGNRHVKACKWDAAIEAYTKAITAYPKDPIFFANRALCYLKKKKYNSVESDCTESIKLDSTYVKAYLRRAAAREALERLEDAKHDLRQVLRLEPGNTQAKRNLDRLIEDEKKNNSVKGTVAKSQHVNKPQSQKESLDSKFTNKESQPVCVKESEESMNGGALVAATTTTQEVESEPPWQPCSNTVQPVVKPPHLRSKTSLKRIQIHDIGVNTPKHLCARNAIKHEELIPNSTQPSPTSVKAESSSLSKQRSILTIAGANKAVPPRPKNSVQFHTGWSSIQDSPSACYQFLKQIPANKLPDIFKESLESRMFSNILETLASEGVQTGDPLLPYLHALSTVKRFSTLVLFMSSADKSNLKKLFEYCTNTEESSPEFLSELKKLYEIF